MKNNKIILVLSGLIVLIVCVTFISISYAYWASVHVSSNNIVNSNCLNIEFKDLTNEIKLYNTYPMSPLEFYNSSKYRNQFTFVITNKCNTLVNYDLNLETLRDSDIDPQYLNLEITGYNVGKTSTDSARDVFEHMNEVLANSSTIEEHNSLRLLDFPETKVKVREGYYAVLPIISYGDLTYTNVTLDDAIYSKRLNEKVISPDDSHVYILSMFLSEDVGPDEAQNQVWCGKVTVNSSPISSVKVSFDINGGDTSIDDRYYYDNGNYGELPIPTREGYTFFGWYYDDESNTINNNDQLAIKANHTLTAKWKNNNDFSLLTPNVFYTALGKCDRISLSEYNYKNCLYDETSAIENILPYEGNINDSIISSATVISESGAPTYAWRDDKTLYYYSNAPIIYMKEDKFAYRTSYQDCPGIRYVNNLYPKVAKIDLSGFDTSLMTNMDNMFIGLPQLTELNLNSFDTSNVISMINMFSSLSSLESLDLGSFDTGNVTNMSGMFAGDFEMKELNLSSFDTSNVTNMSRMFSNVGVTELDLSNFNTSNVTDMSYMLSGLEVEELIVSNFNTGNVTNMSGMFSSNWKIIDLDLSNFDTSNVINMSEMFSYNWKIINLDLSNFDTSKVRDMSYMFNYSPELLSINLSSFDTRNVTDMSGMFENCRKLTSLDLSNFRDDSLLSIRSMFGGCEILSSVDLSGFSGKAIDDVEMLCSANENVEIIGYAPSSEARTCLPVDYGPQC